jgi:hypothetical protein
MFRRAYWGAVASLCALAGCQIMNPPNCQQWVPQPCPVASCGCGCPHEVLGMPTAEPRIVPVVPAMPPASLAVPTAAAASYR